MYRSSPAIPSRFNAGSSKHGRLPAALVGNRSNEVSRPMSTAQQFPPNVQPIRETTTQLAALEEDSLDLRRIAATLRRRKIMIGAIAVIGTVVMTLYVGRITPLYKAETQIVIEPERKKIVNIDQVAQNLSSDWLTPQTEAAIIRSRDRALLAVQRLDLVHNPAFNPNLRPPAPGALEVGKAWLSKALGAIGIELKWLKKPAAHPGGIPRSQAGGSRRRLSWGS